MNSGILLLHRLLCFLGFPMPPYYGGFFSDFERISFEHGVFIVIYDAGQ